MLAPGRRAVLDIFADGRAGRQIRHHVLVIAALLVAQRQGRDLLRMNLLDGRGLRNVGMNRVGDRDLDASQHLVKGSVLQHELDDVLDASKLIGDRDFPPNNSINLKL
jgi:hypothetical protein